MSAAAGSVQAGQKTAVAAPSRWRRWSGEQVGLLLLSILFLSLSFAPVSQFYLAWVGIVPWLIMLSRCGSCRSAFLWSWLGGVAFFIVNMWWLAYVTGPGMLALMLLLGLYWALAGWMIYGAGLVRHVQAAVSPSIFDPPSSILCVLLIPTIWVCFEWLRANYPFNGLPWLFLGHAQTPILAACQLADLTGVYGVSFWVAMLNACVALYFIRGGQFKAILRPALLVACVSMLVLGYGVWRIRETKATAGPRVLVVQPNYPQSNTGAKGASEKEILAFHLRATEVALANSSDVDLVVWSETMMPPLNPSARSFAEGSAAGELWRRANQSLEELARRYRTNVLVGGIFYDRWSVRGDEVIPMDRRNAAYFYNPGQSKLRYDKVHLVPMGEYMPFKSGFPWLYRFLLSFSPYTEEYTLTAGASDALTVFELPNNQGDGKRWRFVTPICYEDIDPALVARMFLGNGGSVDRAKSAREPAKRADFIVNITNDGWFRANEMAAHLQAAIFRGIENRAPTARSVNTGISGFIDSVGRTHDLIPAGREGMSVGTLRLDARSTVYTRIGDAFAIMCSAMTGALAIFGAARWWWARRKERSVRHTD